MWGILKKLKKKKQIHESYDPAIMLLDIDPEDLTSYSTDSYADMFIAFPSSTSRK